MHRYKATLLVLLLASGGCLSAPSTDDGGTTIPEQTAVQSAVAAEEKRIEAQLANESSVSDVALGYEEPTTEVVERGERGVTVRVSVSYAYGYNCSEKQGHVDGLRTRATYLVTPTGTELQSVEKDVRTLC